MGSLSGACSERNDNLVRRSMIKLLYHKSVMLETKCQNSFDSREGRATYRTYRLASPLPAHWRNKNSWNEEIKQGGRVRKDDSKMSYTDVAVAAL